MEGKIYGYNTHYEIMNYSLGDCEKLEKSLSLWDNIMHKHEPKFYYDEDRRILYVPRGYDPNLLQEYFKTFIDFKNCQTKRKKVIFSMWSPPRNSAQKEAVRFLAGKNEYSHMINDGQQVLSMPPGEGKTYCTISALSLLGYRSIIIVNTVDLRNQWKEKFLQYTKIPSNYIVDLDSMSKISKIKKRRHLEVIVFLVTHDILRNYMKEYGNSSLYELFDLLQIGVKVIDEAHLEYGSTLMLDYMTNVWKTIYLSATFARSDQDENKVFQRSFNMIHKLKIESSKKRRHVIYIPYIFRTKPSQAIRETVRGLKGFDRYAYTSYEFSCDKFVEVLRNVLDLFINKGVEGKIVILSSKKESCEQSLSLVKKLYPGYSSCAHYTGNKLENFKEYGIICATPKMLGTAQDIPGLRIVINLEPARSTVNAAQVVGRLREYSEDKDTYYIELVDKAFSNVFDMYKTRLKFLSSIVKQILTIDETIIKY